MVKKSIKKTFAAMLIMALLMGSGYFQQTAHGQTILKVLQGEEFSVFDEDGGFFVGCPEINKIDGTYYLTYRYTPPYDDFTGYALLQSTNLTSWTETEDFIGRGMLKLQNGHIYSIYSNTYYNTPYTFEVQSFKKTNSSGFDLLMGSGSLTSTHSKRVGGWFGSIMFGKTVLQMADGSLRAPAYGYLVGDQYPRTIWMQSTDGGTNWTYVSNIAQGSSTSYGYSNPTVIKCADGSLLCVTAQNFKGTSAIYQSRSYNGGVSWAPPINITENFTNNLGGIDPDLYLMSDGTLALSFGQANIHNSVMFSVDGSGYFWDQPVTNYSLMTSGYTSIIETSPGTLLMLTDRENEIFGRYISVEKTIKSGKKIDLAKMYRESTPGFGVYGIMDLTDGIHRGLGLYGAIDGTYGNMEAFWNSAMKSDFVTPAEYNIRLDRVYSLSGYRLCLRPGSTTNGTITFSTDGVNYSGISFGSGGTMMNSHLPVPVDAQYVKVTITNVSGSEKPMLNEIELYESDPESFEKWNTGIVPPGFTNLGGSTMVSLIRSYTGDKSLRIIDNSIPDVAAIKYVVHDVPNYFMVFSAQMYHSAFNASTHQLIFRNDQDNTDSYTLQVDSSGCLWHHNGSTYELLSGGGTIPINEWYRLRVQSNGYNRVKIYVNEIEVASIHRLGFHVSVDSFKFEVGSEYQQGALLYVDDIEFSYLN